MQSMTGGRVQDREDLLIIGQGTIGLELSIAASEHYEVTGYDRDSGRIAELSIGGDARIEYAVSEKKLHLTATLSDDSKYKNVLIVVSTPFKSSAPDFSDFEVAAATAAQHVECGGLVVVESTLYPGCMTDFVLPLLSRKGPLIPGNDYAVGYSPNRFDKGNEQWRIPNTPKLVSGINSWSSGRACAFYDKFIQSVICVADARVTEFAKLYENTYRYVNIAFVNEMASLASLLGIDFEAVRSAATTKPFGFQSFTPGPGVGGECLPDNAAALAWLSENALGLRAVIVTACREADSLRCSRVLEAIRTSATASAGRILILGWAYKADVAEHRRSPTAEMIGILSTEGYKISVCDPYLTKLPAATPARQVPFTIYELRAADVVVTMTDHSLFRDPEKLKHARRILDPRGTMPRLDNVVQV